MKLTINYEHQRWLLVCVAIFSSGLLGLLLMALLKPTPEITPIQTRTPIIDASPLVWRKDPFEVSASGRVTPVASVQLQAQISGDVVKVSSNLKSGGYISKGEQLVLINPATFKARVAELQAQLSSAEADLKLSKTQLSRSQKLLELRAAAQEEIDQRQASMEASRARVAQFKASLKSAHTDLRRSKIKAPFDGRVVNEQVSVGDVLAPGFQFAEIYSNEVFEIAVAMPVSTAILLGELFDAKAEPIPARVEANFGGARFTWPAYVDRVEPGLDELTRTIDIIVRVDEPEQRGLPLETTDIAAPPLLPSMFATAFINTRDLGRYATVPRDSIRADGSIWFVETDDTNLGEVKISPVTTLLNHKDTAYIKSNLLADNPIYVLGSDIGNVLPGNRVQIRSTEVTTAMAETTVADDIVSEQLTKQETTADDDQERPPTSSPDNSEIGETAIDTAIVQPPTLEGETQ